MLEGFIHWLLNALLVLGYPGIILLMAIESSVLPVPAELVMPPGGYWAAQGEMNPWLVIASGVLGSVLGSLANYWLARGLGRAFVRRYGKYVLMSERSLERSERYFARHGEISVLIGRMLPVVRHLISIPAGIARMRLSRFVLYTALGATAWCAILTWIGYVLGRHEGTLEQALQRVPQYVDRALFIVVPILVLVALAYALYHRRRLRSGPGERT